MVSQLGRSVQVGGVQVGVAQQLSLSAVAVAHTHSQPALPCPALPPHLTVGPASLPASPSPTPLLRTLYCRWYVPPPTHTHTQSTYDSTNPPVPGPTARPTPPHPIQSAPPRGCVSKRKRVCDQTAGLVGMLGWREGGEGDDWLEGGDKHWHPWMGG